MALQIAVIKKKAPTSDTTLDFTETGFGTPVGAIFYANDADLNGTATTTLDIHCSLGFTNGTSERIAMVRSVDNSATSATERTLETGKVVKRQIVEIGSFNSWITDGVRLDWTSGGAYNEMQIVCVLIKGCNVDVGTFTPNATQNATSVLSGLSYEPNFAFFSSIGSNSPATASAHNIFSYGCAFNTSGIPQSALMFFDENGQATADVGIRVESDSVGGQFFNDSVQWTGEVTSFNSDGFTMTTRDGGSGGDALYYLTIGNSGSNVDFKILASPTSTGTDKITTAFQTNGIFGAFGEAYNTDSNLTSFCANFIGANNGGEEHNVGVYSRDNVGTSDVANITDNKLIHTLSYVSANTYSPNVVASVSSYDTDGITLSYSNVGANPRFGWAVIVGQESGGTSSTATPSLVSATVTVPTATASTSETSSSTATPSLVSATVTVPTATASTSVSYSATATPSLASATVLVPTATASTGTSTSATATPSLTSATVSVFTPTTSISASRVASPSLTSATFNVFTPTIVSGIIVTASPSLVSATFTVPTPTVVITTTQSSTATPSVSSATVTVYDPTASIAGAGANITDHIRMDSSINKYYLIKSAIVK